MRPAVAELDLGIDSIQAMSTGHVCPDKKWMSRLLRVGCTLLCKSRRVKFALTKCMQVGGWENE